MLYFDKSEEAEAFEVSSPKAPKVVKPPFSPMTITSGEYSGWLQKMKNDGAFAKWIDSSCRRFFTLDFEKEILYYSHQETNKNVRWPIEFDDLLGAKMLPFNPNRGLLQKMSGSSESLHGFTIVTRDREIKLLAKSESEASGWVDRVNNIRDSRLSRKASSHDSFSTFASTPEAGKPAEVW